ncbi:hypothetical protein [Microseira wollei]|uniref:hypothetical protein n=1 Tax=Microseira wollei TaxID=467598 RepID=UPI001CFD1BA9|nr:hypothetical protein [Microseira wollei]
MAESSDLGSLNSNFERRRSLFHQLRRERECVRSAYRSHTRTSNLAQPGNQLETFLHLSLNSENRRLKQIRRFSANSTPTPGVAKRSPTKTPVGIPFKNKSIY